MELLDTTVLLISGALMLMCYSFLYKTENKWFTFVEHFMIGGLGGLFFAQGVLLFYTQGVAPFLNGDVLYIFAIIGSLLLFATYFKKYSWLTKLPTAVMLGAGIGINLRAVIQTQITSQILATIINFSDPNIINNINNLIILIGVITATLVFMFTTESKGVLKPSIAIGRMFLMITFGFGFAYSFLGRTSGLIARLQDILTYPMIYLIPVAIAVIIYDIYVNSRKKVQ